MARLHHARVFQHIRAEFIKLRLCRYLISLAGPFTQIDHPAPLGAEGSVRVCAGKGSRVAALGAIDQLGRHLTPPPVPVATTVGAMH